LALVAPENVPFNPYVPTLAVEFTDVQVPLTKTVGR